jgi:hypothetical protein
MRRGLVAVAALVGLCGLADRASAQVIYYFTPYYYNSPFNPTVRTYSTPVMYSTYTSPIVVPTRFVYPPFGTVAYDYPPNAAGEMAAAAAAARAKTETKVETKTTGKGKETTVTEKTTTTGTAPAGVVPAGYIQPYPAFRQVGYSTYTTAPLPVGWVYYSGDAYNAPSSHFYTPYAYAPYADQYVPYYNSAAASYPTSTMNYGAYATPYYQIQYGQGYGGWGMGRGWGGWGRGWSWGW